MTELWIPKPEPNPWQKFKNWIRMSLKLVKTNTIRVLQMSIPAFIRFGQGWACTGCNLFIWPSIKKLK